VTHPAYSKLVDGDVYTSAQFADVYEQVTGDYDRFRLASLQIPLFRDAYNDRHKLSDALTLVSLGLDVQAAQIALVGLTNPKRSAVTESQFMAFFAKPGGQFSYRFQNGKDLAELQAWVKTQYGLVTLDNFRSHWGLSNVRRRDVRVFLQKFGGRLL
jgi:hypothetical protein